MENEVDRIFVESVVKQLVDHPEDVVVTRTVDELGVLISVDLNGSDMGMVIGRAGATVKAVRTLLRVIGAKHNARVNLKINEPEGSTFTPKQSGKRFDKSADPLEELRREGEEVEKI